MKTIILPGVFGLLFMPVMVSAEDLRPEVKVSYRDLDLRSASDVRRLDHRILNAIKSVCEASSGSTVMDQRRIEIDRCIKETRATLASERNRVVARVAGADATLLSRR